MYMVPNHHFILTAAITMQDGGTAITMTAMRMLGVFPVQDAALYTYQRTLNIRFAPEEAQHITNHRQVGATFKGSNIRVHHTPAS